MLKRSTSLQVSGSVCARSPLPALPSHSALVHEKVKGAPVRFVTLVFPDSLQVSVLEDLTVPGRKVCVANTHLYWHPKGTHLFR